MSSQVHLPSTQSGLSGEYRVRVVEPSMLKDLRRLAGSQAGIPASYRGELEQYHNLSETDKRAHDSFLGKLVEKYRDRLEQSREEYAPAGEEVLGKNLILDQGINNIFSSFLIANAFTVCCVGTGTTPTFTDSGAVTATASGTTVTSSGSFFTSGMTGMLINFDGGAGSRYITFVDATHATLSSSLTVGSPTLFTVYAVNQTGLDTEVARTSTYLTGSGNCDTAWTSNTSAQTRTYDFPVEVANQNYTELGWSNTMTVGANLFSRTLITGGTVTVLIGQALRVVYTLTVTIPNTASTSGSYSITGWPVAPSTVVTGVYNMGNAFGDPSNSPISYVNTNGSSNSGGTVPACLEPSISASASNSFFLCTGTTLPSFGSNYSEGTSISANSAGLGSYTPGSFTRDKTFHFNVNNGNATNFRGIELRNSQTAFVFVFNQDQTKDNLHQLDVNVTITIGRVLSNP